MPDHPTPSLVFVDLETTGLNPATGIPLELGIVLTDDDLNVLAQRSWLIQPAVPIIWDGLSDVVQKMHEANGIRKELEDNADYGTGLGLFDVIEEAVDWMDHHDAAGLPMCGSNVANFDRPWLRVHMPAVEALFHYRNIDVSTIKETCRRWNPRVFSHAPKKNEGHRALPDCLETIEELTFYKDNFFFVEIDDE